MNQNQRGRFPQQRDQAPVTLPPGYLEKGYFDKEHIRPELITTLAESVAFSLGKSGVTAAQIQRFFRQARAIERQFDNTRDFLSILPDLLKLKASAANYAGKGNNLWERENREVFKQFIDRNIALATKEENGRSFKKGFIPHFESVVAYYKYHFPTK
jgi:CRISPR type III-A-associated protein Csm2